MTVTNSLPRQDDRNEYAETISEDHPDVLDELADVLIKAHEVASRDQDNLTVVMIEGALLRVGRRLAKRTLVQYS